MDEASANNHVDVLKWWKSSGLELKWTKGAMDFATLGDHVDILQWWKKRGLEMKWSHSVVGLDIALKDYLRKRGKAVEWSPTGRSRYFLDLREKRDARPITIDRNRDKHMFVARSSTTSERRHSEIRCGTCSRSTTSSHVTFPRGKFT